MLTKLTDSPIAKIVGWVVAVLIAYGALKTDVAVLDAKYDFVQEQVKEINDNLRNINEHLLSHGR